MKILAASLLLLAAVVGLWIYFSPTPPPPAPPKTATAKIEVKPYPFSTSVVSGQKLGTKDETITLVQGEYEVKLCSQSEAAEFKKNPAPFLAKIQQAYQDAKPYPLSTCLVMGDKLDADAYTFVYEGRQIKFCCKACLEDFEKDPAKYVTIWDNATKSAAKPKK